MKLLTAEGFTVATDVMETLCICLIDSIRSVAIAIFFHNDRYLSFNVLYVQTFYIC